MKKIIILLLIPLGIFLNSCLESKEERIKKEEEKCIKFVLIALNDLSEMNNSCAADNWGCNSSQNSRAATYLTPVINCYENADDKAKNDVENLFSQD